MLKTFRTLQCHAAHFLKRSQEGVACVEFALCIPFLLALLMGSIEVGRYMLIAQKVEKTAVTIADVVAQASTATSSQLNNIIFASSQVMTPYSMGADGYVIITSVKQTGTYSAANPPRVNWQYTSSGANGSWSHPSQIGTPGNAAALPNAMVLFDKDNVIIAEVFYNYQPIIATNDVITGTTVYKVGLYKPRLGDLSVLGALPAFWAIQKGALL